ncbi:MAG: ferritin family protein [Thermodesulfobacteriota bacterium]|jgi:rubrerythrin|nr:MAG: ferritin family protein [Thermodesulfobacteriota bacterium]
MSIFFNPDEVLEMAEQIERNGAQFYRHAAQEAHDGETRALLQSLAAMEDGHQKVFAKMRANLKKEEIDFNADEQALSYLKAWADGHVFDMKSDSTTRMQQHHKNMEDILTVALGLEKESIAFYLGMKNSVNNNTYRDRIDEIIKEEMKHIVLLSAQLSSLKK